MDVYANIFYTISDDVSVEKERLADIILECIRQMLCKFHHLYRV
jgi:hypothetical protein